MQKVLITGGSGMLGNALIPVFSRDFEVHCIFLRNPPVRNCHKINLDITKKKELARLFKDLNPDLTVHAAALTNVDYCEKNPQEAYLVNAETTKSLVESASDMQSKVIYISTDYIFDGKKGNYLEEDKQSPVNVYGQTKLKGEGFLRKQDIIARTSIFGWNQLNKYCLAEKIIHNLRKKENISLFCDSFSSPILTNTFSELILKLYNNNSTGIFNAVCDEKISKYELGIMIADIFGLDKNLIKKDSMHKFEFDAKRPVDCSLNNLKIKKELNINNISLLEDIKKMVQNERRRD